MAYSGKLVFFVAIIGLYSSAIVLGSDVEGQIKWNVLSTFDEYAAPIPALNEPVIVEFGLSLKQIILVSEAENSITTSTLWKMGFTDYRLTWDPNQYNGTTKIRIPYQHLWNPDITLYNSISEQPAVDKTITALVYNHGYVYVLTPMRTTASCKMDLAFFPYDTQICTLKFGSYAYDSSIIDIQSMASKVDLEDYWVNPEWDLINSSMTVHNISYPCCPTEFRTDVTATLEIQRRSGPYTVKLVIPSVLTAFLILFTFLLPSSSGEKIVFCLVLLLTLMLLLVYLHISMPSNSESVLSEFLTFALFLDFFATIIAVVCYNIADALLMRDKLGIPESEKHWSSRERKLKCLRITEFVFFLVFLLIFIIGTGVILTRRG